MTYQTIDNLSNANIGDILSYPTVNTPTFFPLILVAIFIIITMVSFFRELNRESKGNLMSSLAVSGFITTVVALAMSLLGLIQREVVVIILVISIIFEVIFLLTGREK